MTNIDNHVAHRFIEHCRGQIAFFHDTFWRFEQGQWYPWPRERLRAKITGWVLGDSDLAPAAVGRFLRTLPDIMRNDLYVHPDLWNTDPDELPCANGRLNISDRSLVPLEASHHLMRTLDAEYDPRPEIACPAWEAFLQTTVPAEADFLQEFAGLSLTFDTRYETAVWLCGPPGSGKSTFLSGLMGVLGSRGDLLDLPLLARGQYSAADLFGVSLLASDEQPIAELKHDHLINALVSGEEFCTQPSGGSATVALSHAKWIWALTSLPHVANAGSGLFRRARIVNFPARPEADRDPSLKSKIAAETPGILRWALAGLQRLRARGRFSLPASIELSSQRFHESNDPVAQFLREKTQADPASRVQSSALYVAYDDWCLQNGHKLQSGKNFAAALERLGYQRRHTHGRAYWLGLQLVPPLAASPQPSDRANLAAPKK